MSNTNVVTNFLAGGVGGACTVIVGHPFDTVKVRLQTQPFGATGAHAYAGTLDCFKKTIAVDGLRIGTRGSNNSFCLLEGLYKGMAAPLAGVSPLFAIFFGGCAVGRWLMLEKPGDEMTFTKNLAAGGLAGVFTTVVMVPGERIKCLLQVQSAGSGAAKYNGPLDVARQLYKEGGMRSIYRGTGATLLRDVPASAAYLSVYEFLKRKFAGASAKDTLTPSAVLMAGGLAGIANWSVCIPADVLKSRLQTAPEGKYPNGVRDVFKEVVRTEGPSGLFRGFAPVMLRAFPANAACFFGMELTLSLFRLVSAPST